MLAELEGDNAGLKAENDGLRSENEILRADVARLQLRVGENQEQEKEGRRCRRCMREGRVTAAPCEKALRHAEVDNDAATGGTDGVDGRERRRAVGASALHVAYMEALDER